MLGGKLPRTRLFWMGTGVLLVTLVIGAAVALRITGTPEPTPASFSDFLTGVSAGSIKSVVIAGDKATFERRDGTRFETVAPQGYFAANPTSISSLVDRGIRVDVTSVQPSRVGSFGALALGLIFFGFAGLAEIGEVAAQHEHVGDVRDLGEKVAEAMFAGLGDVQVADHRQPEAAASDQPGAGSVGRGAVGAGHARRRFLRLFRAIRRARVRRRPANLT